MKYGTKNHAKKVCDELERLYPDAGCSLEHYTPLELLVATILSAQCTDARVNLVTPALFQKYPTAEDYALVSQEELENDIRSTGFYHNKAKNIRACCKILAEQYGGEVPPDMEVLVTLPGVGRKTANCVLGAAYGIAEGIVVDTHVQRLSQRIGLTHSTTPEKIEADLIQIVPQNLWIKLSHQLILHGRNVCPARKPRCEQCTLVCRSRPSDEKS
ncbi:MAG: endonuclease III [Planctomycetia bacterium]|nr:endonuclease III [Planctomycetia bacterium]